MLILIFKGLILCIFLWTSWNILRRLFVKTDLDNIPGPPSNSFLKGNLEQLFDINGWAFHQDIAEKFGRVVALRGLFGSIGLYVFDPKALHHILVKDQYIFEESDSFIKMNHLLFGGGILTSLGETHRKQRKMLNPVFSINNMRNMIPMFYDVAHKLRNAIGLIVKGGPQEVEVLRWMTRAALEIVGQSGLGYSFDPLTDEKDAHPYSISVKDLAPTIQPLSLQRVLLLPTLIRIGSPRFRRFFVDLMPWKNVRKLRDIIDIMDNTTIEIFEGKKRALREGDKAVSQQIGQGKDIISILMKANMEASEEDRLPDSEVIGQMSTIICAAMDSTSNALSRILYLLASHPEVQTRLRQEVSDARETHGDVPYDELVALPYLDAICRETLRLHPPTPVVLRTTKQDVILPLSTPIKGIDGREIQEIAVPNGTDVFISILNTNRDPALWGPDSYEWKPERWLSPLPHAVTNARIPGVYANMLTFLGGGRACIGFKFSQLEMKVFLLVLISQFRFSLPKIEIIWEMGGITTPSVKGEPGIPRLPLTVEPISKD